MISVIVPAYNAESTLENCLTALLDQSLSCDQYEVIVVDDGSTDQTAEIARQYGVHLIHQPNAGPAAARNRGAQAAEGDILLFTDADCAPTQDWIERMTEPLSDAEVVGVKGTYRTRQLEPMARFVQLEYKDKYARVSRQETIDFIDTYSAAYRRDVFLSNGGFDTIFPAASVEDQEFSFRLARLGYRLTFAPQAIVYHRHAAALGEYWRRKRNIGYWKALLLRWHPERAVRDSHTPQVLKVQIGLAALIGIFLLLTPFWLPARWLILVALTLFVLTTVPFVIRVLARDPAVAAVAPFFLAVRAFALGSGLAAGLLHFCCRPGSRRQPMSETSRFARRATSATRGSDSHSQPWRGRLLTQGPGPALCAVAVGLISLGVYLATLAPGLTWAHDSGDGGELAAAAYVLGIPHPPGYPTFLLIAHLFTFLPVGEIATRTNLFSAICAAGTSALLTWTLVRTEGKWACAVGAGWALAFSPLLWSQATVTEVHALNGLFTALLLVAISLAQPDVQRRRWSASVLALATGCVWGLSLGNHLTALFCGPLVFLVLWRLGQSRGWGALGIALGLTVYLYLPLRAAANPPINWGDPQTLEQFWWMVSGAPYRQFVFSLPRQHLFTRTLAWSSLLTRQFGWLGLVVVILGAIALWKADRALLYASGTAVALCSIFAIGYNTTDSYLYLIPALVCLGLWLGTGLNWFFSVLEIGEHWTARASQAGVILVILVPLVVAANRFSAMDLSDDQTVRDFEAEVLGQAPPKAIILSQRDTHTFTLWYLKYALGQRPDVDAVDLDLLGYDWYATHLSRQFEVEPPGSLSASARQYLLRWSETLGRPLCRIEGEEMELACTAPGTDWNQNP